MAYRRWAIPCTARWTDPHRPNARCYKCGPKLRVRGSACSLNSVPCWLLEQTLLDRLRTTILSPRFLIDAVARANQILSEESKGVQSKVQQAQKLAHLGAFVAERGSNPILDQQYAEAERNWRIAQANVEAAKSRTQHARPISAITPQDAEHYASHVSELMLHGGMCARRDFLARSHSTGRGVRRRRSHRTRTTNGAKSAGHCQSRAAKRAT
jgi:multidrug efflux pump subunit AcrA (membrane-fusion protein)